MSEQSASRGGRLDKVIAELVAQAPEIEAAAVVSFDGLPMVSALPPGMDEDRVAAMSAALLSLGERAAEGLGRGQLSQVYIEGESGTVFLVSCDDEAVLVAVAAAGAKAGLMLYEVRRAAGAVATVLREDEPAEWSAPLVPQLGAQYHQQPVAPAQPAGPAQPAAPAQPVQAPPGVPAQASAPTGVPAQATPSAVPAVPFYASAPAQPAATQPPVAEPGPAAAGDADPAAPVAPGYAASAHNGTPNGSAWSSYAPSGEPTPWS